jgi:hypothetical protein
MYIDFNKYNNEITQVSLNDDCDCLVLQTSLYKITIKALAACCSYSILEEYKDYKFNNLVGKIIRNIKEIDLKDEYNENDEDGNVCSPHIYEIKFKNSNKKFYFMLMNYSNGYYDGCIDMDIIL